MGKLARFSIIYEHDYWYILTKNEKEIEFVRRTIDETFEYFSHSDNKPKIYELGSRKIVGFCKHKGEIYEISEDMLTDLKLKHKDMTRKFFSHVYLHDLDKRIISYK